MPEYLRITESNSFDIRLFRHPQRLRDTNCYCTVFTPARRYNIQEGRQNLFSLVQIPNLLLDSYGQ
jgi:hypothetical protein